MDFVDYSKQRYNAVLSEIERLKNLEFPYDQIRDALGTLEQFFLRQQASLNKIKPPTSVAIAQNACGQSLGHLFNYTPFLGFILRSTNVRNAFEIYSPLLRMAKQLLGPDTKLLLSSEWDYSPYVLTTPDLPEFVLIGVPAFESSNPLIMALSGHELGHNAWSRNSVIRKFGGDIESEVLNSLQGKFWPDFQSFQPSAKKSDLTTDMFVRPAWLPALAYSQRQLEEIFCDAMGLRLFGEAFLHAFAYLLSPSVQGERFPYYPAVPRRAHYLAAQAGRLGVDCPADYVSMFMDPMDITSPTNRLLCEVADDATERLWENVSQEAVSIADAKNLPRRDSIKVGEIVSDFERVVPTNSSHTLTDVINAGWICAKRDDLWKSVPQINKCGHANVLSELVLKSLEIGEFYDRIGGP